jgi:hypothetical protein
MKKTLQRFARSITKRRQQLGAWAHLPGMSHVLHSVATLCVDKPYDVWLRQEMAGRAARYPYKPETGLLSLITPVWNTPIQYLRVLAKSVIRQRTAQPFEWVVVDNGSQSDESRAYLKRVICARPWVKYLPVEQNVGIVRALHMALEHATGRYVLPVDHDDFLYPDCISIVTSMIQSGNYPALLYSDEDFLCGEWSLDPYIKPHWDPVLFLNSAYTAHLGVIDRRLGLSLGIYTDPTVDGSPDWDAFARFFAAGYSPVHIPEVLYSWRMHAGSTASNMSSKSHIHSSQQSVLNRYLETVGKSDQIAVELSPLFQGTPDWRFMRQQVAPCPLSVIVLGGSNRPGDRHPVLETLDWRGHIAIGFSLQRSLRDLAQVVSRHAQHDGLVAFVSDDLKIHHPEWAWQALGLIELHSDVAIIGGRICRPEGTVMDAGRQFGYGRGCDCPDRDRITSDPGYHAQMFKERSVDAVPIRFSVFKARFLCELLANRVLQKHATLCNLGPWAGAAARRRNLRVAYSPFLAATTSDDWSLRVSEADLREFVRYNSDVLNEARHYPAHLDATGERPYREARSSQRDRHLAKLYRVSGIQLSSAKKAAAPKLSAFSGSGSD